MTKIKLRRLLKNRVIELYKKEVEAAIKDRHDKRDKKEFSLKLSYNEQKMVDILRKKIGYSLKTNDFDIFHSFIRLVENK